MTDAREQAHRLIDRLPENQLSASVGLMETIVDPVAAALRNAPLDDEPETDDESRPSPKRVTGSPGVAAKVSRMTKPCGASAWSESDRWTAAALEDMAALDKGIAR